MCPLFLNSTRVTCKIILWYGNKQSKKHHTILAQHRLHPTYMMKERQLFLVGSSSQKPGGNEDISSLQLAHLFFISLSCCWTKGHNFVDVSFPYSFIPMHVFHHRPHHDHCHCTPLFYFLLFLFLLSCSRHHHNSCFFEMGFFSSPLVLYDRNHVHASVLSFRFILKWCIKLGL